MRLTKTYADGSYGVADDLPCGENSHQFKKMLIDKLGAYEEITETSSHQKLIAFAKEVIQVAFEGGNLDGWEIQDWGVKHGLLVKEEFDSVKHTGNYEGSFEDGDWIYLHTNLLTLPQAIKATESPSKAAAEADVYGNDCPNNSCS